MSNIVKSREIKDAHISFVSLVGKAANRHSFAIVKADDGKANFSTFGPIVKVDDEQHFVTGVVYEPETDDTQGDFMTAEEIQKAAYWYMENGQNVDIQHSFQPFSGATTVESWVTKSDQEIGGQKIQKGTWMMTMKITDPDVFAEIQKGDITGFSMGGSGTYVEEAADPDAVEKAEKKGVLAKLKKWLSGEDEPVQKGVVADRFNADFASRNLMSAWYALEDALLDRWDPVKQEWGNETDPQKIQEALQDFTDIANALLSNQDGLSVFKSADGKEEPPIIKAGKAMSKQNKDKLQSISDSLSAFLSSFDDGDTEEGNGEEEIEVTKEELNEIVKSAVAEAMKPAQKPEETQVTKTAEEPKQEPETITKADVQAMIDEAIKKAMQPEQPEENPVEKSDAEKMAEAVQGAVAKAMEPYLKQEGLPTNLNGADGEEVAKSQEEQCFLQGII